MNNIPPKITIDKNEFLKDLGKSLVTDYGKKEFYQPKEVLSSLLKSQWSNDLKLISWGLCAFCSHLEFDSYNSEMGQKYNYNEMRMELLSNFSFYAFPGTDLNIDVSWLDLGDFFDGFGDLVGGILDGFN